jgi:hypothetical protein
MHRSSDTIGAIAAALAKAQGELTNPEKSLIGTIALAGPQGGDRSFRYASLSSGLDIIRKSLGRYEIAAVQTTAIDGEAGLVRLTTVLAHSSGEWISSEWPVCPVSDTAAPRRMGAALTYARRYALFTLVGIAGEDDLDAPDLPVLNLNGGERPISFDPPAGQTNGHSSWPAPAPPYGSRRRSQHVPSKPILNPQNSAQLRDQLLSDMAAVATSAEFDGWAHRSLPAKNTLVAEDAKLVEEAFQAKLAGFGGTAPSAGNAALSFPDREPSGNEQSQKSAAGKIDKSVLALPETRRLRDKHHLRHVAKQACLVCGREPSDAHHLRFAQSRGLGLKVSDEFTVPLCRVHHREVHQMTNEAQWWDKLNLDPVTIASTLWAQTHPLPSGRMNSASPAPEAL